MAVLVVLVDDDKSDAAIAAVADMRSTASIQRPAMDGDHPDVKVGPPIALSWQFLTKSPSHGALP